VEITQGKVEEPEKRGGAADEHESRSIEIHAREEEGVQDDCEERCCSVGQLPADHALRKMENVTLSPHLGYVHEENYRVFYRDTVENVAAWLAGKPIRVINA